MDVLSELRVRPAGPLPDNGAVFDAARHYRYALWRVWGPPDAPLLHVIGLNPSTANEQDDDPTIRRCRGFARDLGCGGLLMTNLFALRTTDPSILRSHGNPVGDENTQWILKCARLAAPGRTVCAWGVHVPRYWRNRPERLTQELRIAQIPLWCWGRTKAGQPRHPLYLPADTALEGWN
jgi:hypothetical protein